MGDRRAYGERERKHRLWHSLAELAQAGSLPALVLLFLSALFRIDRGQPYSDFETYELRDRYRTYGVGE
jgi:hypothetical protein